jgi:hypothetical protein
MAIRRICMKKLTKKVAVSLFCAIFVLLAGSAWGQAKPGELTVAPNGNKLYIYNDTDMYKMASSKDGSLPNISIKADPGTWIVDNGYDKQVVTMEADGSRDLTLKAVPDMGKIIKNAQGRRILKVTDAGGDDPGMKFPAWLGVFSMGGMNALGKMPEYQGLTCFVVQAEAFHRYDEKLLKFKAWEEISQMINSVVKRGNVNAKSAAQSFSDVSSMPGFTSKVKLSRNGGRESIAFEEHITVKPEFKTFLASLGYKVQGSWWIERVANAEKGEKVNYMAFLFATVSTAKLDRQLRK